MLSPQLGTCFPILWIEVQTSKIFDGAPNQSMPGTILSEEKSLKI